MLTKYLRIMGLLAVFLGAKIILCLCKKRSTLMFYRWFLNCLQMNFYGILNVLLNILGPRGKWVGGINKIGLTIC